MPDLRIGQIILEPLGNANKSNPRIVVELKWYELSVVKETDCGGKITKSANACRLNMSDYHEIEDYFIQLLEYFREPLNDTDCLLGISRLDYVFADGHNTKRIVYLGENAVLPWLSILEFIKKHMGIEISLTDRKNKVSGIRGLSLPNAIATSRSINNDLRSVVREVVERLTGEFTCAQVKAEACRLNPELSSEISTKRLNDEVYRHVNDLIPSGLVSKGNRRGIYIRNDLNNENVFSIQTNPLNQNGLNQTNLIALEVSTNERDNFLNKFRRYCIEKNFKKDSEVYSKIGLSRQDWNRFINPTYVFNKEIIFMICFVLKLSLAESEDLLLSAGFAINPMLILDGLYYKYLSNRDYDVDKLNEEIYFHYRGKVHGIKVLY